MRDDVEEFLRNKIETKLYECTEKQVDFFHRIFPDGVPTEKLESALDLIERTIKKNERDGRV